MATAKPPNMILLITDQQRQPRHWPQDPAWLRELTPNDHELKRTALSFTNAFCNTAMCSPSRATLLLGRYPAEHGVKLTLTAADLRPDPRNSLAVVKTMAGILRSGEAPRARVLRQFAKGALGIGRSAGGETELPAALPGLAGMMASRGYHVAYKGKWHLTHPSGEESESGMLSGWTAEDATRLQRDYGLHDWEPPDAGENAKAEHFGGGNAGEGEGWDEVYTRQVEKWLGREKLPEPFCLIVSLVNPHDVLGYPACHVKGGYSNDAFRDLGVELPLSIAENLRGKPAAHTLMRLGMDAYLGPLATRRQQLDYVNFYAYLHRVVDEKIGRILTALGSAEDPESLRSRTVIVRTADHGELGLAHGGLRQKMFNAYEETINVPLLISNPRLFSQPAETESLASLIDILPTMLTLAGADPLAGTTAAPLRGRDLSPIIARNASPLRDGEREAPVDLGPVRDHPAAADSVQDAIHFTYDDHQAATAMREAPGHPNRIRAVRMTDAKYAIYFDPRGKAGSEYEMYDLDRDPLEVENLVDVNSGTAKAADAKRKSELKERLLAAMEAARTDPGGIVARAMARDT